MKNLTKQKQQPGVANKEKEKDATLPSRVAFAESCVNTDPPAPTLPALQAQLTAAEPNERIETKSTPWRQSLPTVYYVRMSTRKAKGQREGSSN